MIRDHRPQRPDLWQVMGSNHGRLSRRFYSPSLLPEPPPADQRGRDSRRDSGPSPSVMRPWAPGSGGRAGHGRTRNWPRTYAGRATDEGETGHGQGRKIYGRDRRERLYQPSLPILALDLPFQESCSVSSSSLPGSVSVSWMPRAARAVRTIRPSGVVPYRLMRLRGCFSSSGKMGWPVSHTQCGASARVSAGLCRGRSWPRPRGRRRRPGRSSLLSPPYEHSE
jgi:hypothetical protein